MGKMSYKGNVLWGKYHMGEMSYGGKCHMGKVSPGDNVI